MDYTFPIVAAIQLLSTWITHRKLKQADLNRISIGQQLYQAMPKQEVNLQEIAQKAASKAIQEATGVSDLPKH